MVNKERNYGLTNAREALKLTQKQIAKEIGLSIPQYNSYENLKNIPSMKIQKKLSKYFIERGVCVLEEDLFPKQQEESFDEGILYEQTHDENLALLSEKNEYLKKCLERILKPKQWMPKRQVDILKRYYGIGCEQESVEEIAKTSGENGEEITETRLYKIIDDAYLKLRERFGNDKEMQDLREIL